MFVGVRLLPPASVQTGDHLPLSGAHRVIFYFSTRESHHCWTGAPIAVLSGIRTGLHPVQALSGPVWTSFCLLYRRRVDTTVCLYYHVQRVYLVLELLVLFDKSPKQVRNDDGV